MLISKDFKRFFDRSWDDDLKRVLTDFEEPFGTCYYCTVQVGFSRLKKSADHREGQSLSTQHDQARMREGNISIEGPNINVQVAAHRNS